MYREGYGDGTDHHQSFAGFAHRRFDPVCDLPEELPESESGEIPEGELEIGEQNKAKKKDRKKKRNASVF